MKSYKKSFLSILMVLSIIMSFVTIASAEPVTQTWSGYITSEDDFAAGLGADTASMVHMKKMAMSGLGITFQQDGKWVFYYFDGAIATDNNPDDTSAADDDWVFNGTLSQLKAWNIVAEAANKNPKAPVPVTVTGMLNGNTATNPGPDKDGLYFPVITVSSMVSIAPTTQTWTGYITTEDDFAAGLGADNAFMVYMKTMAMSGLGITFQQNGKWVFYYFDGTISTGDSKGADGKWAFDGKGTQLTAWNIVGEALSKGKYDPVPVTVTGTLNGHIATNPGLDKDGLYFPVITVNTISAIKTDQTKANILDSSEKVLGSAAINLDKTTGTAAVNFSSELLTSAFSKTIADSQAVKTLIISIPRVDGATTYVPTLPASFLTTGSAATKIIIKTVVAEVTLPGNMLKPSEVAGTAAVSVSLAAGDTSNLAESLKTQIGTRPSISFDFMINGMPASWSSGAAVTVKIPYTRTATEKTDVENITIWDIDSMGKGVAVLNGRYETKAQAVYFNAVHSGNYAIGFTKKAFSDIGNYSWAAKQIGVLASKGIINGTSATTYSPSGVITRAEFVTLLIRTTGLQASFTDNYADVSPSAYYYNEVGVAKALGITTDTSSANFNPDAQITRQDMMTLTELALIKIGVAAGNLQLSVLDKFTDKGDIAGYALASVADLVSKGVITGSGDKINPLSGSSRAEVAVILYRIFSLYIVRPAMA